jgi:hypothetical protein
MKAWRIVIGSRHAERVRTFTNWLLGHSLSSKFLPLWSSFLHSFLREYALRRDLILMITRPFTALQAFDYISVYARVD